MHVASTAPPVRDLFECLDAWMALARRLARRFGVAIRFVAMAEAELGEWHSATSTLYVRFGAALEHQVLLLHQLWAYLAIGPHAAPDAHRQPVLQLVPPPRVALDHQLG